MATEQTQLQALDSIGNLGIVAIVLLGLVIVWLGFIPSSQPPSKIERAGPFVVWGGFVICLVWFTFDPAIRAMKFVNSPTMFTVIGITVAVILFAVRQIRKDFYGALEIAVAIATFVWLGKRFDTQNDLAVIVSFVGAIYVIVRGLSNIVEYWSSTSKNTGNTATG